MPTILYLTSSQKQLAKLPKHEQVKVIKVIRKLANDPYVGKPLAGSLRGLFSARAWPYRIIYRFIKQKKVVVVETIEHRQEVYK